MIINIEGLYEDWCTVWSRSNEKLFEGSAMLFLVWDEDEKEYMMMLNDKRHYIYSLDKHIIAICESSLILIDQKDWNRLVEMLFISLSVIKVEKINFKKLIEIYFGKFHAPWIVFSSDNLTFDMLDQFELEDEQLIESETLFIENEESGLLVAYNINEMKAYLQDLQHV